jgi:hypothetical protein
MPIRLNTSKLDRLGWSEGSSGREDEKDGGVFFFFSVGPSWFLFFRGDSTFFFSLVRLLLGRHPPIHYEASDLPYSTGKLN